MDQQESGGDITRQQLGGMTNKERFHEGRRIPKQLRRILWELWSPVVTSEDEPDDWQLLEVLDWYLASRRLGAAHLLTAAGSRFLQGLAVLLMAMGLQLLFMRVGSISVLFPVDTGWTVSKFIALVLIATTSIGCMLGTYLASHQRRQLSARLRELDIMELVSGVIGSPVSEYELVRLPALARGQPADSELLSARMLADNLELFLGLGGNAIRRRLMSERVLAILRGTALASGVLITIMPLSALPLLLVNIILTNDPKQFTNRRHELLLAMLDEMYPDGTAIGNSAQRSFKP
ncbi:MAG: hypothetical protein R3F46_05540 [bacterium]